MTTSATRTATFLLRQPRQVQGYREPLTDGVDLTLLWIPPGRFWMGSPEHEPERFADEGPQHLVQLQGFFMGQTPITQAQWRAVAQWQERPGERWGRTLNPNPSRFMGDQGDLFPGEINTDQRPVEQVSWHDAMEFCHRLRKRSGRQYILPSEAQWEYACRAGTTTPFHCGETITPALANYNGNYTYADGPKGEYRKQSTPVEMFPANAWGLHDMHGNVWEWCLDHFHESYEGAPTDGSAWLDGAGDGAGRRVKEQAAGAAEPKSSSKQRLLRGGSWLNYPWFCRSAYRYHLRPVNAYNYVGFRVVCLPQDPSLNP